MRFLDRAGDWLRNPQDNLGDLMMVAIGSTLFFTGRFVPSFFAGIGVLLVDMFFFFRNTSRGRSVSWWNEMDQRNPAYRERLLLVQVAGVISGFLAGLLCNSFTTAAGVAIFCFGGFDLLARYMLPIKSESE